VTLAAAAPPPATARHDFLARAIGGVCLDVDDTLVDYGTSMRAGLRELLGADDAWADWCAVTEQYYPRFTSGEIDFDTMRWQRTREFFAIRGEVLDDGEVVAREERRMAAMQRAWQLFDDALPCLRALRAGGLRLAAVTNAAGEHQRGKLRALGLDGAFDVLMISDELGVAKPDAGIFHAACAALDIRAGQAVHVGDRLDLDAEAAHAAGLHGVWLDRSRRGAASGRGDIAGVTVISELSQLPDLVDRLGGGEW
jgi:putative hydrolase of the HAD superfamily